MRDHYIVLELNLHCNQSDSYTKSVAVRQEYCLHDTSKQKKHVKCLIHIDCTKLILVFRNKLDNFLISYAFFSIGKGLSMQRTS